jgi:peptidyl-prolyl cis-trans isomerase D
VTDKQDGRLATVALRLEASEATADKAFTQATKFEIEATEKILMLWQREMGLTVVPGISVSAIENFGPLGNQRSIVRWAFEDDSKVGTVKDLK